MCLSWWYGYFPSVKKLDNRVLPYCPTPLRSSLLLMYPVKLRWGSEWPWKESAQQRPDPERAVLSSMLGVTEYLSFIFVLFYLPGCR